MTGDDRSEGDWAGSIDEQTLRVSPSIGNRLSVIGGADLSVTMSFAETKSGEEIVMPFAEWLVSIRPMMEDGPPIQVLSLTTTLDNIAFLLEDLSREFGQGVARTERLLSDSEIRWEIPFDRMVGWLRQTARNADEAAETLSAMEARLRAP